MAGSQIRVAAHPGRKLTLPLDSASWMAVVETLQLAPQQARIVELILRGLRDKQIAAELGLGVPTVRTYLKRVFVRVGVQDRVELVLRVFAVAWDLGGGRSPQS